MTAAPDHTWVYDVDLSGAQWRRPADCPPGDDQAIEIAFHQGMVAVRNPAQPELEPHRYTPQEWEAFVKGVRADEFALPGA